MRVWVYFNLHKKVWSVMALEGPDKGRVIARSSFVVLDNPVGKVRPGGRLKVIATGKKNVHAGIIGQLASLEEAPELAGQGRGVTYNPFKYDSFVYVDDKARFEGAERAYFDASDRSVLVA